MTVQLAPGVAFVRTNFRMRSGNSSVPEQSVVVGVTLSSGTSLVAKYPDDRVSGARSTLRGLAYVNRAVAGVSGNVFIDKDRYAAGDGGVSDQGVIVKSELKGKDDSLWVDSTGHAHIGDPGFDGHLTTGPHVIHVSSVNYVDNAEKGAVTVLDYHQSPVPLTSSCLVATLAATARDTYRVMGVWTRATRFGGVSGSTRALMSCGTHAAPWLATFLKPGVTLTGSWGYATSVVTLMSGANHIEHLGKAYHDPTGIPVTTDWFQTKRVPEDFACVLRDSTKVLLGSVVGWKSWSAGMTYAELGTYLAERGCVEAIALNALYQSTVVAKLPGQNLAVASTRTTEGEQKLVNGLLVTSR